MVFEVKIYDKGNLVYTTDDVLFASIMRSLSLNGSITIEKLIPMAHLTQDLWLKADPEIPLYSLCDYIYAKYDSLKDMNRWDAINKYYDWSPE